MVVLQVVPLVVLDIKALGWLLELVVLASCSLAVWRLELL
jgi:hypothetical protein